MIEPIFSIKFFADATCPPLKMREIAKADFRVDLEDRTVIAVANSGFHRHVLLQTGGSRAVAHWLRVLTSVDRMVKRRRELAKWYVIRLLRKGVA